MKRPTKRGRNQARRPDTAVHIAARSIDALAAFDRFREELLPALQQDVMNGTLPKEMRKKYLSHVQASQLMTALTDEDAAKRLAAQKDILDREEGKATEKKEISHRLGALPQKELDALLISTIDDLPEEDEQQEG